MAHFPKVKEATWQWPRGHVTAPFSDSLSSVGRDLCMINMHTKIEVSSLSRSRDILGEVKIWNGSRDVTTPISGTVCQLLNPHTKFEVSTITCNEDMTGNAKCTNYGFEPPFRGLGSTHRVHLWLDRKRSVDFLLAIIELFASSHSWGTN